MEIIKKLQTHPVIFTFILVLILISAFPAKVSSQITITDNSFSNFLSGEFQISSLVSNDQPTIIPLIEQTGADQVWDLTTLTFDNQFSGAGIIETFTDISGTPGEGDPHFEQATHISRSSFNFQANFEDELVDFDILNYSYVVFNNNEYITLGSIVIDPDNPEDFESTAFNRPGIIEFQFPVNFENTWEYEYESEIVTDFNTFSNDISVTVNVDGWGQLVTPDGTFDVLRITKTELIEFFGIQTSESIEVGFYNTSGIPIAILTADRIAGQEGFEEQSAGASVISQFSEGTTTSNEEIVSDIPSRVRLNQNYPNPFNPTTQITYELANPANVSLDIYSVTGKKIMTLENNRFRQAGTHTVSFEGSSLASGIYIYQLKAGDQVFTRKMTLIK